MLPSLSTDQLETLDDAALIWAGWLAMRELQDGSLQSRREVYALLSPGWRALWMVQVVRGHADQGALHLFDAIGYILDDPASWPAIRSGYAYFGAESMVALWDQIEGLFQKVRRNEAVMEGAQAIDRSLAACLDEALRLVGAYVRSHPEEYNQS